MEVGSDLGQLMLADITPEGPLLGADGALSGAAGWANAFRRIGRTLGMAARGGTLQRGLREVTSYAVIFHWNRLGLPARTQSILAHAARTAILGIAAGPVDGASADRAPVVGAQPVRAVTALQADLDRAVARFPLVLQGRWGCPDLDARVRTVREFADSCHAPPDVDDRIDRAGSVFNLTALIAADCGMPSLATDLSERLFQVFQAGWPVSGRTAIASLQPLVNLARLERRAGDPDSAFRTLDGISRAVRDGGSTLVHGTSVSFDGFIAPDGDRSTVDPWLRTLLREEGTRTLAAAGRWAEAAANAERYGDAGDQLREARQARVAEADAVAREAAVRAGFEERKRQLRGMHDTALTTLELIGGGTLDLQADDVRVRCGRDAEYLRGLLMGDQSDVPSSLTAVLVQVLHDRSALGLVVHPQFDDVPAQIPTPVVEALTFAVREALNNVTKHADVTEAWVTAIGTEEGGVRITVVDRGSGFDPANITERGMMRSIWHRMEEIHGGALVDSAPGQGTFVELSWTR